ncbi:uncharacterized protein LAESUDRAFT_718864 [Laetiporus sulphureus 93-53]|uniref:Uncharacterized protein n=1 Tax=Laetiporus sulphureus 93-53 TaxID=1314785 RepID=A0A165I4L5_9APHY|nr:uncharacterized protein LAESUDRAFT_718864 [Laetiporus sulphureus 93-53]KZT12587.1 hypothetical protein LAESUDRAFT_718864 [Laetiporus sulphureus 93-53]
MAFRSSCALMESKKYALVHHSSPDIQKVQAHSHALPHEANRQKYIAALEEHHRNSITSLLVSKIKLAGETADFCVRRAEIEIHAGGVRRCPGAYREAHVQEDALGDQLPGCEADRDALADANADVSGKASAPEAQRNHANLVAFIVDMKALNDAFSSLLDPATTRRLSSRTA